MAKKFISPLGVLRRRRKWSLPTLAELSGVNLATLEAIENRLSRPTSKTAGKLARVLECKVDDLFRIQAKEKV